jgi:hypothetical protein
MKYKLRDISQNKSFWLGFAILKFLQNFLTISIEIKSEISELERHLKDNKKMSSGGVKQLKSNSILSDSMSKDLNGKRTN